MIIKKTAGFTLIELLVVISIIGMLSSVVLASLASAREKGRITAGVTFSKHMFEAYGTQAYGAWSFDELASDGNVEDISPSNVAKRMYMQPVNNPIVLSDFTPRGVGKSVVIEAEGPFPRSSWVAVGLIPKLTLSSWVYVDSPNFFGAVTIMYAHDGNNTLTHKPLTMRMVGGGPHCIHVSHGITTDIVPLTVVQPKKWYHMTCTVNTQTKKMAMYLDGKMVVNPTTLIDPNPEIKPGAISVGGNMSAIGTSGTSLDIFVDEPAAYYDSPI